MLTHMVGIRLDFGSSLFNVHIKTSGGLLLLMIIPMVTLLIVGYWSGRKLPNSSPAERVASSIVVAIVYSLLFSLVSLLAGASVNQYIYGERVSLTTNYSFGSALLHGFIISFVFVSLGSLLSLPKELKSLGSNRSFGISIARALITTFLGVIVCAFLSLVLLSSDEDFRSDELSASERLTISTEFGGYFWEMAHLNSTSFTAEEGEGGTSLKYSILKGFKLTDYPHYFSDDESDEEGPLTIKFAWIVYLVPVFLHIWSGRQLRRTTSGKAILEVAAYAVGMGILTFMLAYILNFSLYSEIYDFFSVTMGVSLIKSFFTSGFIALLGATIGWLVFGRLSKMEDRTIKNQFI
ncbi:hypothetical protein [Paenibacillus yonginensis]|nr:hypothetical protein [Paenibacillus yonginensis]